MTTNINITTNKLLELSCSKIPPDLLTCSRRHARGLDHQPIRHIPPPRAIPHCHFAVRPEVRHSGPGCFRVSLCMLCLLSLVWAVCYAVCYAVYRHMQIMQVASETENPGTYIGEAHIRQKAACCSCVGVCACVRAARVVVCYMSVWVWV